MLSLVGERTPIMRTPSSSEVFSLMTGLSVNSGLISLICSGSLKFSIPRLSIAVLGPRHIGLVPVLVKYALNTLDDKIHVYWPSCLSCPKICSGVISLFQYGTNILVVFCQLSSCSSGTSSSPLGTISVVYPWPAQNVACILDAR